MDMVYDPCACGLADVNSQVEVLGLIGLADLCQGKIGKLHQLSERPIVEPFNGRFVGVGNNHDVPAGVREAVKDDKCLLATVEDEVAGPVGLAQSSAENADITLGVVLDIGHSPGRPDMVHDRFPDSNITRSFDLMARGLHPSYNAIMLTVERLRAGLPVDGLGEPLYFFSTIGSTSQYARELAEQGAPHGTLVVADEQTAGRGRGENQWSTPPQSAIAFSLVLRPDTLAPDQLGGMNAIGSLAVVEAIEGLGGEAEIKWPNDVLVHGAKVAGVLTEATWRGNVLECVLVGVGVNVHPGSVPDSETIAFPAACLDAELNARTDRHQLLMAILENLAGRVKDLGSPALVQAWHDHLAFKGKVVRVETPSGAVEGQLAGLTPSGFVKLEIAGSGLTEIGGEGASLRPIDT